MTTESARGLEIHRRVGAPTDKRGRWEQDKAILTEDVHANPGDARAWFYLAQTHECLGELELALTAYRRRVALGGWLEEKYESEFRIGRVLAGCGQEDDARAAYQAAYRTSCAIWRGGRAEPLRALADLIPFPTSATLFVDAGAYKRQS